MVTNMLSTIIPGGALVGILVKMASSLFFGGNKKVISEDLEKMK
jgi:HD-like signal output (HDOD) protein